MLQQIHLTNYAVIESLELDFTKGMTVLTGETGAGKSILIDALGLALGGRLQTKVVRHGATRCDIYITFFIDDGSSAKQWLTEHELLSGEDCIIRRSITDEGRSKCYINSQPVPLQSLRDLGERLINIYGQHEHQNLLKREQQRLLLDAYAGHQVLGNNVNDLYLQ